MRARDAGVFDVSFISPVLCILTVMDICCCLGYLGCSSFLLFIDAFQQEQQFGAQFRTVWLENMLVLSAMKPGLSSQISKSVGCL